MSVSDFTSSVRVESPGLIPYLKTPIGKAYEVPVQPFLHHILPRLHERLNLQTLMEDRVFQKAVTLQGQIWGYKSRNPSDIHKRDVKIAFRHLQRDIRLIVREIKDLGPPLAFHNNKEGKHVFEERGDNVLPDAFFLPAECSETSVQWSDIAVVGEYQVEDSTRCLKDNIRKISRSMLNCMRNDPRRRFVYAFTIEDATMRLWYCDRSQVFVSIPFNFNENSDALLHFVISVSFAEPYMLGWDPTMTSLNINGQIQYDITVRSANGEFTLYRTLGVLSDSSTRKILGRGTRVWKATKIVDGEMTGDPVALKDAWVDSDRQREGDIYFQLLQSDFLAKQHPELRKYFISVQTHGDVFVAGALDRTPTYIIVSPFPDPWESHSRTASGISRSHHTRSAAPISPFHQVHYRIVYGEVGEPLAEAISFRAVYKALVDVVNGIAMHRSGWVHRDLSASNILVVNGVGKITDLEYATNQAKQKKPGPTGTAFFVAVEVDSGCYLFLPPREAEHETLSEGSLSPKSEGRIRKKRKYRHIVEPEGTTFGYNFRCNPLHDLESLWWVAVYFAVNREIISHENDDDAASQSRSRSANREAAQRGVVREFFHQQDKRQAAFCFNVQFMEGMGCLHPSLRKVGVLLEKIRIHLRDAYTEAEKSLKTLTFDFADSTYNQISDALGAASEAAPDFKIRRLASGGDTI
ncbi:hypothetical protein NM688_g2554 [Phlebia brevispora]|uniref:Uncharacterized protein n=1 Tax=Phlebia brevispora TaxID=194682 RepID=A0ACC1T8B6_9APHY|nr:hypothetical protein NM688_g2554 [Phlebia brevispora]